MAQLIKLRDFISRYETDIFRYPSQYIRLKKERWEKLNASYAYYEEESADTRKPFSEVKNENPFFIGFENLKENWLEPEKKGALQTIKRWLTSRKADQSEWETSLLDEAEFQIERRKTKEEMKREFLDELFRFQIHWASSTIRDYSFVDESIYKDKILKYFLQHFPDTYLVLYKPTFLVKKAPIDLDIILISPVKTYCISVLESEEMSVFQTDKGRYWIEIIGQEEVRRINPMISLNRTQGFIQSYYEHYQVDMPIQKVVLSRTGFIEGPYEPIQTLLVDKRNYEEWYLKLRNLSSPLKYVQLKGAQALLKHTQSTYVRRYEWEQEDL
ncbi:NERD domain-containing protein [Calidifontibacillus erzurumensis]|uniref:NERD domain-containing protein n=1 Tax=Calidifontibacillus erzurumensis TaxID=2741433 RepID=A0A8J8K807_9BACI|nr:NERD domain-containing protein [Calidifontibacillus erzurumensis]NSL51336.1 NERD domain-containing protein [Calidifontibacillus erzurumensis]